MPETQGLQLHIMDLEKESNPQNQNSTNFSGRNYKWWIKMVMFMVFVLAGQASATLLGRLYYAKGGQKQWIAALVQAVGFPILIPFYFLSSPSPNSTTINTTTTTNQRKPQPSFLALTMVYAILGLLLALGSFLTSYGLSYLSASTFSIIFASQLGFTALFSFFLNSQRFTPFIINSIVLLTISSILLAFQPDSSSLSGVSKAKHAIGFVCTVLAAAGTALGLALSQFFFRKVIKKETFSAVLDMIIFESFFASCLILIGLFASGEWKGLSREMEGYELGKVSYVMTLLWIAVSWQLFQIGAVGLIFEVSSLFCNVMSALGLPLIQVLAVIIFHDKMDGLKVVAMILAIWGFVSYIYQHYIDDHKSKSSNNGTENNANANGVVVPRPPSL